jgi:hypothetical protein
MSVVLRIILVIASFGLLAFIGQSIKKAKMRIEDSLFWVFLSILIFILSIFPQIASTFSDLLGFQAPVNFIYLFFIFILLVKSFNTSKQVSELNNKVKELSQQIAVDRLDHYERKELGRDQEFSITEPGKSQENK